MLESSRVLGKEVLTNFDFAYLTASAPRNEDEDALATVLVKYFWFLFYINNLKCCSGEG